MGNETQDYLQQIQSEKFITNKMEADKNKNKVKFSGDTRKSRSSAKAVLAGRPCLRERTECRELGGRLSQTRPITFNPRPGPVRVSIKIYM